MVRLDLYPAIKPLCHVRTRDISPKGENIERRVTCSITLSIANQKTKPTHHNLR